MTNPNDDAMKAALDVWNGYNLRDAIAAAIAVLRPAIRAEALREAAEVEFLRPLIEEQSKGEWDDKTIDEDVGCFAAAIRAMKEKP